MAMAALAGCAASATLYPANDAAVTTGVLHGQYLSQGTGSGWLKIPLPTGELLQGEYSVQSGPTSVSFGSILARAAAPRANAKVSGLSISATSPGARSGIAALFGDHGTTMHCEFYVNPLGNGAGGCETGAGALYQLFF
jgi:hypothetical protein